MPEVISEQNPGKTANTFYKNANSSVSSTNLVAIKRFSKVLLDEELSQKEKQIQTDPQTVLITAPSLSPRKSQRQTNENSKKDFLTDTPAKTAKSSSVVLTESGSTPRRNNSIMNKISLFENNTSAPEQTALKKSNVNNRFKKSSEISVESKFGIPTSPVFSNRFKKSSEISVESKFGIPTSPVFSNRFKITRTEEPGAGDVSDKENVNINKNCKHNPRSNSSKKAVTIEPKFKPQSPNQSSDFSAAEETQPIAVSSFIASPAQDDTVADTTAISNNSTVSVLTPPRITKQRNYVTTAFTHNPIYSRSSLSRGSSSSLPRHSSSSLPRNSSSSLPRTATAASFASERPLSGDAGKHLNLSSSASIAGSMMSERPLFDTMSENINDDETVYLINKTKSSNSIISESIFDRDTHDLISSSISDAENRDVPPSQLQRQTQAHVQSQLPRKGSLDHKLTEFSYLFNVKGQESANSQSENERIKSMIIASSSVRSDLAGLTDASQQNQQQSQRSPQKMEQPAGAPSEANKAIVVSKISSTNANNTVRFNEEITEYEHPEVFYDDSGLIDGSIDQNNSTIQEEEEDDDEDEKEKDSHENGGENAQISNEKSSKKADTNTAEFNESVTSSVIKRALNAAKVSRNNSRSSTKASNRSSLASSDDYSRGYRLYEDSRYRRRSRSKRGYRKPVNLENIYYAHSAASLSHLPANNHDDANSTATNHHNNSTTSKSRLIFRRLSGRKSKPSNNNSNSIFDLSKNQSDIFSDRSRGYRSTSVASSRISFTSATSRLKLNRKFSAGLSGFNGISGASSRRNSSHYDFNSPPDAPVNFMQTPLFRSAVQDLEPVYGEGKKRFHNPQHRRHNRHEAQHHDNEPIFYDANDGTENFTFNVDNNGNEVRVDSEDKIFTNGRTSTTRVSETTSATSRKYSRIAGSNFIKNFSSLSLSKVKSRDDFSVATNNKSTKSKVKSANKKDDLSSDTVKAQEPSGRIYGFFGLVKSKLSVWF